ncbi:acyltransferase family protein [Herbiconiux liukaitaii]|uniref:acyltransferase family protein n=1 Tax=Herbiconiux liukaitaii TaxID=3342799 RepID=UPI0035BB20AC
MGDTEMPSGANIAPKKVGQIPSLNGLRAVAVFIVIYAHSEFPGRIAGSMGVGLFFFLSGYLITTLLRAEFDRFERISLKDFYTRRVLRILPPMYIVFIGALILALVGILPSALSVGGVLSSGTFLANYWTIFNGHTGVPEGTGVLWSLAVEEHFYLVFPVIYIAMRKWLPNRRHQVVLLVAICVAALIWRCYLTVSGASPLRLYYATDTRADAIVWGAILAIGFNPAFGEVRLPNRRWFAPALVIVSALTIFAASRFGSTFTYSIGFTVQAVAAFGLFIPLILAPQSWIGRILNWAPVAWIGVISYTLYLVHQPVFALAKLYLPLPHPIQILIGVGVSVLLSWAMLVLVERPIGKLRKRLNRAGETENVATEPERAAPVTHPTST